MQRSSGAVFGHKLRFCRRATSLQKCAIILPLRDNWVFRRIFALFIKLMYEQLKTWISSETGTANKTPALCMKVWEDSQVRKSNNLFTFTIMRLSINLAPSRIHSTHNSIEVMCVKKFHSKPVCLPHSWISKQLFFPDPSTHWIVCAHLSRRFIVERSEHTSPGCWTRCGLWSVNSIREI